MVVIRLTRVGKKKQAHYRIVVAESKRAVQGKFISILGWYNPHTKELQVKKDELQAWFDKGATPSNTLAKLLKKEGVKLPKWVKIVEKKKAPKKKEEAEAKPAAPKSEEKSEEGAEAPAGESAETSVEEATQEAPAENAEPEAAEEEKTESDDAEATPDKEPKEDK